MGLGLKLGTGAQTRSASGAGAAPAAFNLLTYLTDNSATAYFNFGDPAYITKDVSNNVTNMANLLALDVQLVQNAATAGVWSADMKSQGIGGVDFASSRYHSRNEADTADVNLSALISVGTFVIGAAYYADAGLATTGEAFGSIISSDGANNHIGMTVTDDAGTIRHVNQARVASLDSIYNRATISLNSLRVALFKKTGGQMYTSIDGGSWSTPTAGGDVQTLALQLHVGTSGISPGFQYFNGAIYKLFFMNTVPSDLDAKLTSIDAAMRA